MPNDPNRVSEAASPVRDIEASAPQEGIGLCLSGGGYRAMVFHIGALWRLNEAGYLVKLDRISSVSGGSITAGVLGLHWNRLQFDASGVAQRFNEEVVAPLRDLAGRTLDAKAVVGGILLPGTIAEYIASAYDKHLFKGADLQALPDKPRFVINATNVQSGALWRFSKPYMADYRVGQLDKPTTQLAMAVGASSAFPPFLSPATMELPRGAVKEVAGVDLHREPFTTQVVLTDGGVYDNLGLETVWKKYKTVLVSDAGGKMQPEPEPHQDWVQHMVRVLDVIDNQVRSLRKRQVIDAYEAGERRGGYWGIRTNIVDYKLPGAMPCPFDRTTELANTPTRLQRMESALQERLINWGYAVCDAALRKHVDPNIKAPRGFPYPGSGI